MPAIPNPALVRLRAVHLLSRREQVLLRLGVLHELDRLSQLHVEVDVAPLLGRVTERGPRHASADQPVHVARDGVVLLPTDGDFGGGEPLKKSSRHSGCTVNEGDLTLLLRSSARLASAWYTSGDFAAMILLNACSWVVKVSGLTTTSGVMAPPP